MEKKNEIVEKIFLLALGAVSVCLMGVLIYKVATGSESKDFQLCRDLGGVPIPSTWDSNNLSACVKLP